MPIRKLLILSSIAAVALLTQSCSSLMYTRHAATRHIARDGDTLGKLAIVYYGSEAKVDTLIEANPDLSPMKPLDAGTRVSIPID